MKPLELKNEDNIGDLPKGVVGIVNQLYLKVKKA